MQVTLQTPAPAPKTPVAQAPTPAPVPAPGPAGTGDEFDRLVGAPLTGLEKPDTTRAGPAILELSTMFTNTLWIKVYLPVPAVAEPQFIPDPKVMISRVLDRAGNNFHDADNTFETKEFFHRASLTFYSTPVPHLAGTRSVNLRPGLAEQALQRAEGQLSITLPIDPRVLSFDAAELSKEKSVHDSALTLLSVTGGAVQFRLRAVPNNYLGVRAFGADGKAISLEARQVISGNQAIDQEMTVNFKAAPARVEVVFAARLVERSYPFSVQKGAVAGPPR